MWSNLMNSAVSGNPIIGGLDIGKNTDLVHDYEKSSVQKSPLEVAIMNGHFDWLKEMLEKLNIPLDKEEEKNEDLLTEGEYVNKDEQRCFVSTIDLAIAWGNIEIIRLLVEFGVKIDQVDFDTLSGEVEEILVSARDGTLVPQYKIDGKKKKK